MTDPEPDTQPAGDEQAAEERAQPPGEVEPAADPEADPAPDAADTPAGPVRPQPPAMTPAEIAQNPTAMVRVSCDGRCGQARDIYAGDTLPTDADGQPLTDPRATLMAAAGCNDQPAACPGAIGATAERDTFNAVTDLGGLGGLGGPGIAAVDLSQLVNRVRGGRDPELQPASADAGVAPIPMLTVNDLEQAANGEVRLPIAVSPFEPPPSPMLAALGVDVENLEPTLTGMPPGARVESGEDDGDGDSSDGDSADASSDG